MKPRIFVSSTFYDLKYVREDLANFIRTYNFEPILFEEGDIGYGPNEPLDESCYNAMRNSDMAVLIIGGQYGTNATNQPNENNANFISITEREFRAAADDNIPVFAFVDAKVYTEYDLYKANIEKIKENPNHIVFRATKDIRVFEFISNLNMYKSHPIPITAFSKIQEIKDFLSKQWSDLFQKYLKQLRENNEIQTIKLSVSTLKTMVDKMSIMMDAIGKSVINNNDEFDSIKIQQDEIEVMQEVEDFLIRFSAYTVFDYPKIDQEEDFAKNFVQALNYIVKSQVVHYGTFSNDEEQTVFRIFSKYGIKLRSFQFFACDALLHYKDSLLDPKFQQEMQKYLSKDLRNKLLFS